MNRLHQVDEAERTRIIQSIASDLTDESGVLFAYLYGSFVESHSFRDIDLGVFMETLQADKAAQSVLALAQRLSERARMPMDVRVLNLAPVSFVYHVLRGQLVFCRDAAVLGEVMERTISRYLDIAPLLRWGTREAFAG